MKIKIFSSFCSSDNAVEAYKRVFGENSDIEFVDVSYEYAIILNTAMPKLECPKENVIGFAFEPVPFLFLNYAFVEYAINNIGKYYIGEKYGLPEPFVEHHSFMWHTPIPNSINPKTKLMSIIFSKKDITENHKYRRELIIALLENNFPVDVWGVGCDLIVNGDSRVKGKFNDIEPYDGYLYTISIENFVHPEYISEKVLNPLVLGTIPLYLGAKNIDNYFPGYTIKLTGNLVQDINIIYMTLVNKPIIQIEPEIVRSRINIYSHLKQIFNKNN